MKNIININGKEFNVASGASKHKFGGKFTIEIDNKDSSYFIEWLYKTLDNKFGSTKDVKQYSKCGSGIYHSCQPISVNYNGEISDTFSVRFTYDSFEDTELTKQSTQLVEINVPEGKKLIKTDMESGVLFTFEDIINWKLEKQKMFRG